MIVVVQSKGFVTPDCILEMLARLRAFLFRFLLHDLALVSEVIPASPS
jgi:hypothetical protein